MASKKEIIRQIRNEGWYKALIEECKALLTERVWIVRQEVIYSKWLLGDLLYEYRDKKITNLLTYVSKDIGVSERECWRCYRFKEKFPELFNKSGEINSKLLPEEGKNISWNKIVNKYNLLSGGNPCQHDLEQVWRCKKCKTIIKNVKKNINLSR